MGYAGRKWNKMLMQPFHPGSKISDERWAKAGLGWGSNIAAAEARDRAEGKTQQDTYVDRVAEKLRKNEDHQR